MCDPTADFQKTGFARLKRFDGVYRLDLTTKPFEQYAIIKIWERK